MPETQCPERAEHIRYQIEVKGLYALNPKLQTLNVIPIPEPCAPVIRFRLLNSMASVATCDSELNWLQAGPADDLNPVLML